MTIIRMTISRMTFSRMTLSRVIPKIRELYRMSLYKMILGFMKNYVITVLNELLHILFISAKRRFVKCHSAKCHGAAKMDRVL
jgi:hypothetical protein